MPAHAACLIDTDILSEILKRKNAAVAAKAAEYVRLHGQVGFSSFTRYEILRWMHERGATTQLVRFQALCSRSLVYAITDDVLDRAARLWVEARRVGHPIPDADLIIAATAVDRGLQLVTGNTAHFSWISTLALDDWRTP